MGDGLREAEHFGAGGAQVNRVVVAGHLGVLAADIGGCQPARDLAQRQRRRFEIALRLTGQLHAATEQGAVFFPQWTERIFDVGDQAEGRALDVGLQVVHVHADLHLTHAAQRAQGLDAVGEMDQPQQWKRKTALGHQLHLQGECQHVRIGGRHQAAVGKAADLAIGVQLLAIDRDPAAQAFCGQLRARHLAPQRRVHEQTRQGGRCRQVAPR